MLGDMTVIIIASDNAALTHLRIRLGTYAVVEIAYKATATTKLHVTLHNREGSQKRSDYFQYIKKFAACS